MNSTNKKTADWRGSDEWWLIVQTMPLHEALQHLHDYKAMLIEQNKGKPQQSAADSRLTRINAEIKRLNRLVSDSDLAHVAKEVLPPEWYERLIEAKKLAEMGRPYELHS